MICRVITLKYDADLCGFPEDPLRRAQGSGNLLEAREHYFELGGMPHLTLVLLLDAGEASHESRGRSAGAKDPVNDLPEALRPLYRSLRQWRNERAKAEGVPAYAVFRNAQLAEICRRLPRSQAALREIEGIGEATCRKHGEALLAMIPSDLKAAPSEETLA